jgi:hypothetical protein
MRIIAAATALSFLFDEGLSIKCQAVGKIFGTASELKV